MSLAVRSGCTNFTASMSLIKPHCQPHVTIRQNSKSYRHIPIDIQHDIEEVEQWASSNYLKLNATKCKYMIISRKPGVTYTFTFYLNGVPLERVEIFKYLGVLLRSNLSWSDHIAMVCSKARKLLGLLYRQFYNHATPSTIKQLYLSLVRPHLEYMQLLYGILTSKKTLMHWKGYKSLP